MLGAAGKRQLGDALLTILEIFVFVIYFWILITIFGDLFRLHKLSD